MNTTKEENFYVKVDKNGNIVSCKLPTQRLCIICKKIFKVLSSSNVIICHSCSKNIIICKNCGVQKSKDDMINGICIECVISQHIYCDDCKKIFNKRNGTELKIKQQEEELEKIRKAIRFHPPYQTFICNNCRKFYDYCDKCKLLLKKEVLDNFKNEFFEFNRICDGCRIIVEKIIPQNPEVDSVEVEKVINKLFSNRKIY